MSVYLNWASHAAEWNHFVLLLELRVHPQRLNQPRNFFHSDYDTTSAINLWEPERKLFFKHLEIYLTKRVIPPERVIVISLIIQSMNKNHYHDKLVARVIDLYEGKLIMHHEIVFIESFSGILCTYSLIIRIWTSLVARWLRIHLPMQGTQVWALVREDPTCRGATKPVHHNYWACAL